MSCSDYGQGDDLKWWQRFSWAYMSRINWLVLDEVATEKTKIGAGAEHPDEPSTSYTVNPDAFGEPETVEVVSVGENRRVLTIWELLGYGVASTVGAGIYVVTGQVANQYAGPAIVLCFLIASFAALIAAFAYAEFAARIPVSGSAYTFAYVALGEAIAWFIGSNLTLEYAISASAVARGFSENVAAMFQSWGVILPAWLVGYPISNLLNVSPLSAILILVMTGVLCFGVQASARFNIAMVILNVSTILLVIYLGSWAIDTSNYQPFIPPEYGFVGVLTGTGIVFFSYVGFDSVSTLAGEVRDPSRDLPIGIVGTLGIATALYIGVCLVLTGMMSYVYINISAPLSYAFTWIHMDWAASLIAVASVIALTATTLCSLLGQPRIFYQMAVDGLLWPAFCKVNKHQVPVFGTIFSGIFSAIIAFFLSLHDLTQMISIGTLMAFTVVSGGVIIIRCRPDGLETEDEELNRRVLRMPTALIPWLVVLYCVWCLFFAIAFVIGWPLATKIVFGVLIVLNYLVLQIQKQVNMPASFKCPLVPLLPCVGMLANITIIVSLPVDSIYRVVIWSAFCFVIYFGYGIHHSKLNGRTPTSSIDRLSTEGDQEYLLKDPSHDHLRDLVSTDWSERRFQQS